MSVTFSESHIPWLAELEHAIFTSANHHGELDIAKDRVITDRKGESNSFPTPPWLQLSILSRGYLILVFPKEFWNRVDNDSNDKLKDVLSFEENPLREVDPVLRNLRNAVAHADIELLENSFNYTIGRDGSIVNLAFEAFSVILYRLVDYYKKIAIDAELTST